VTEEAGEPTILAGDAVAVPATDVDGVVCGDPFCLYQLSRNFFKDSEDTNPISARRLESISVNEDGYQLFIVQKDTLEVQLAYSNLLSDFKGTPFIITSEMCEEIMIGDTGGIAVHPDICHNLTERSYDIHSDPPDPPPPPESDGELEGDDSSEDETLSVDLDNVRRKRDIVRKGRIYPSYVHFNEGIISEDDR